MRYEWKMFLIITGAWIVFYFIFSRFLRLFTESRIDVYKRQEILRAAEEYVNINIAKVTHILLDKDLTEEEMKSIEDGGII